MKKTYTVVHIDTDERVEAHFPDFPGLTVPGDRLADTIFSAPLVLRRYVEQLIEDRSPVPEPTTPDIWAIHGRHPEALIGFAEIETDQAGKEIAGDEALDDEISRAARRSRLPCGGRGRDRPPASPRKEILSRCLFSYTTRQYSQVFS